jgi:hypothetical protein
VSLQPLLIWHTIAPPLDLLHLFFQQAGPLQHCLEHKPEPVHGFAQSDQGIKLQKTIQRSSGHPWEENKSNSGEYLTLALLCQMIHNSCRGHCLPCPRRPLYQAHWLLQHTLNSSHLVGVSLARRRWSAPAGRGTSFSGLVLGFEGGMGGPGRTGSATCRQVDGASLVKGKRRDWQARRAPPPPAPRGQFVAAAPRTAPASQGGICGRQGERRASQRWPTVGKPAASQQTTPGLLWWELPAGAGPAPSACR